MRMGRGRQPLLEMTRGIIASLVFLLAVAQAKAEKPSEAPSAEQMMIRAHQARAVWNDFPGFTAKVAIVQDGQLVKGRLKVNAEGEVKLDAPSSPQTKWARRKLKSLVAHRAPSENQTYNVAFADQKTDHPLGRKIEFRGDRLHSVYRIQGRVIREVHRTMGEKRFTISVIEVTWNRDEKYLPKIYTVTYWDTDSGQLTKTQTTHDQWTRLGRFDLPTRILTVTAEDDGMRTVREIRLSEHQLLEQAEAK